MSLESLLTTLKEYHPKRLVCLFGCGGNRARSRRFEMGEVSGRLADLTIITSDNPRFEKPLDIIADIRTGIEKRMVNTSRYRIGKRRSPGRSTTVRKVMSSFLPEKDMKITRRSKAKNIRWMSVC